MTLSFIRDIARDIGSGVSLCTLVSLYSQSTSRQLLEIKFTFKCRSLRFRRRWNQEAKISLLPPEVIVVIMDFLFQPDSQRERPSSRLYHPILHTCHRLRQIGLGTPSLWTQVDANSKEAVEEHFRRARGSLVTIRRFPPTTVQLILERSSKWSQLILPDPVNTSALLLEREAPELKVLDLRLPCARTFRSPRALFSSAAPKLHVLSANFLPKLNDPLWPRLTRLELVDIELSTTELYMQLQNCPSLHTLQLRDCEATDFSDDLFFNPPNICHPNILPSLQDALFTNRWRFPDKIVALALPLYNTLQPQYYPPSHSTPMVTFSMDLSFVDITTLTLHLENTTLITRIISSSTQLRICQPKHSKPSITLEASDETACHVVLRYAGSESILGFWRATLPRLSHAVRMIDISNLTHVVISADIRAQDVIQMLEEAHNVTALELHYVWGLEDFLNLAANTPVRMRRLQTLNVTPRRDQPILPSAFATCLWRRTAGEARRLESLTVNSQEMPSQPTEAELSELSGLLDYVLWGGMRQ